MSKCVVVQFAKWPVAGRVKTRLAKDIGDDRAREVHIQLMTRVLRNISGDVAWDSIVSFGHIEAQTPEDLKPFFAFAERVETQFIEQIDGDLGERMLAVLDSYLKRYDKVIIVGSDCPTITKSYLKSAFSSLETEAIVLGPAEDGGYVLIGASRVCEGLFDKVKWGTETVAEQTIENVRSHGLGLHLLPTTWDVDTLRDYQRWLNDEE